jgi:hypothetical protein
VGWPHAPDLQRVDGPKLHGMQGVSRWCIASERSALLRHLRSSSPNDAYMSLVSIAPGNYVTSALRVRLWLTAKPADACWASP